MEPCCRVTPELSGVGEAPVAASLSPGTSYASPAPLNAGDTCGVAFLGAGEDRGDCQALPALGAVFRPAPGPTPQLPLRAFLRLRHSRRRAALALVSGGDVTTVFSGKSETRSFCQESGSGEGLARSDTEGLGLVCDGTRLLLGGGGGSVAMRRCRNP